MNVQMDDPEAVIMYGAPTTMWIRYTVRPSGDPRGGVNTFVVDDN